MSHPATVESSPRQAHKALLAEWERNRRNEVWVDLYAHFWRCAGGLSIGSTLWWAIDYFSLSPAWHLVLAYCALAYIAGTIIIWLRLEGSYLERRLENIEAAIHGDEPTYYTRETHHRWANNGLHEKLDRIEQVVRR